MRFYFQENASHKLEYSVIRPDSNQYCTLVHQYDRFEKYRESLEKACQQKQFNV
jgi:hypothetical protein